MLNNKVIRVASLISLMGHCLFLGMPVFKPRLPYNKVTEIEVEVNIEEPYLLPEIDAIGKEKRLKEVTEEVEPVEPEPEFEKEKIAEKTATEFKKEIEKAVLKNENPSDEEMFRYQDIVKQKIEKVRRYPCRAERRGVKGSVYLEFVILSDGIVSKVRLLRSSGFKILDNEAISIIKRAEPFPPIPEKMNITQVQMEITIVFDIKQNRRKSRKVGR